METEDEMKGRLKEAAGALTGNSALKHEGRSDQVAGKAKGLVQSFTDKAKSLIDSVTHRGTKH
jgi:uncharacterized protein YjbJ (UPF0337 family)